MPPVCLQKETYKGDRDRKGDGKETKMRETQIIYNESQIESNTW